MNKTKFEEVYLIDCSSFIEKKKTDGKTELSYLSWANAWAKFKVAYPDATYEIVKNENNLPFFVDANLGIMVYTKVTAEGETHEMWLPVMDGSNKAMRLEPWTYKVKDYKNGGFTDKVVKAADMFDINKTVMRCLTKNLAMFGLGLSIYSGEDIPQPLTEDEEEALKEEVKAKGKKTAPKKETPAPAQKPAPSAPEMSEPSKYLLAQAIKEANDADSTENLNAVWKKYRGDFKDNADFVKAIKANKFHPSNVQNNG